MSLLFVAPNRDMRPWKEAILKEDTDLDVEIWPDVKNDQRVQFAVTWQQPKHTLDQYPNLQAISSLGAGVDHLLEDETIPSDIQVCRVVVSSLVQQMQEYVLNAILNYQRNMNTYFRQQQQALWKKYANIAKEDIPVGVMGLGALGKPIASQLATLGYTVHGWSNSTKEIEGVQSYAGNGELNLFLSQSKALVCLLPLTNETRGILDLDVFKQLQQPGYLINTARGEHLVEEDLIYALDKEWLNGACLDVFTEEPLPENHPFWNRENIIITPHVSSITRPDEVAEQIVENYKRALSGMPLQNKVNKNKGY